MKRLRLEYPLFVATLKEVTISSYDGETFPDLKDFSTSLTIDTGASHSAVPAWLAEIAGTKIESKVACFNFKNSDTKNEDEADKYDIYALGLFHPELGSIYTEAFAIPERETILIGKDIFRGTCLDKGKRVFKPLTLVMDWRTGHWGLGRSSGISSAIANLLIGTLTKQPSLSPRNG